MLHVLTQTPDTTFQSAEFLVRMLIALLGGMLIGLERERAQVSGKSKDKGSIPGLRSFGLISLYGALSSYLTLTGVEGLGNILSSLAFSGMIIVVLIYAYVRMAKLRILGVTTYIVMLTTFIIGVVAGLGYILEAASSSVLVTLILALKMPAEKIAASIKYDELLAMLEVASLALVIGPIVKTYSAQENIPVLFKIYLFFVIILLISFTSYMMGKVWGEKGLIYSAILGSLVNSEATLSSLASLLLTLSDPEERLELLKTLVPIILSTALFKLSLLAILALWLFGGLVYGDLVVLTGITALFSLLVGWLYSARNLRGQREASKRQARASTTRLEIVSPLSWSSALKTAAAYTLLTGVFALAAKSGLSNLYFMPPILSFLGGLVNATAVILSIGTTVTVLSHCQVVASVMLSLAAAALNKILYARTSGLEKKEFKVVVYWSLVMSMVPLALSLYSILSC